jgi:hypothetical protein
MSSITEGWKTEMNDLQSEVSALESRLSGSQSEMEGKFERQQKEVTSIMEQQIRHFREGIEVTQRTRGSINRGRRSMATCGWRRSRGKFHYSRTTEIRRCNILGSVPPIV